MAIVRAKPLFIIGSLNCKEQFICDLQKCGFVEIKQSSCFNKTAKSEESHKYEADRLINFASKVESAISGLKKFCSLKRTVFAFKKLVPYSCLAPIVSKKESLLAKVERINSYCEEIERNSTEISFLEQEKIELEPYLNFDFYLNNTTTKFTDCFIGICPRRFNERILKEMLGEEAYFEIVHASKSQTVLFIIVLKNKHKTVNEILAKMKFSVSKFNAEGCFTAQQHFNSCSSKIEQLKHRNSNLKTKLEKYCNSLTDFELLFDYFKLKLEQNDKLSYLSATKNVFVLEGYLNPKFKMEFERLAKKFNLYYNYGNANVDEQGLPVDFANGNFVAPVESVTRTYSMPSKFDLDPNPTMAFFYYLFFGMMFSDAGYGLIMTAFCSVFAFFKKVSRATKQSFRMFFWCGVSTIFWGTMFGSFFGNFIDTASKLFLGMNFSFSPVFIDALNEPMKLLEVSLFLGLIQLLIGVFMGFISMLKFKNFKEAFCVKLNWVLILLGSSLLLFSLFFFKIKTLEISGKVFVLIGALMVVLLSGYSKKGFLNKLLSGVLNLYGSVSYVGDVLSYCRLMALAIATGVVANVVNLLSTMMCVNVFGFLAFVVVFVFGHSMNFGINMLGAYVHTVRLQYVEFFSKFYEGGGRLFLPYGLNAAKYFEFEFDLAEIK